MTFLCSRFQRKTLVSGQLVAGLVYALVLHGYRAVFTLVIAVGNFLLTRTVRGTKASAAIWIYNLTVLVVVSWSGESWSIPFISFRGMAGWAHTLNIVMLRMISYGVDYSKSPTKTQEKYGLTSYLGYVFYGPLFLAGPIMTFDSWSSQVGNNSIPLLEKIKYGVRWVVNFFLLEVLLHLSYANAISAQRSSVLNEVTSPVLAFSLSVCVLFFMWLKFLLIWRFFRFWSLLNDIDPPENMNRCLFNNYSMVQFWKDWHSSFNLWLIQYLYIPLGGSRKNRFLNILIVFTFVALWHDFNWRVFHWAWLVFAIMTPELICSGIYRKKLRNFRLRFPTGAKMFKALFAAFNVNFLILANMVGYVFGVEGVLVLRDNVNMDPLSIFYIFFAMVQASLIMLWAEQRKKSNRI